MDEQRPYLEWLNAGSTMRSMPRPAGLGPAAPGEARIVTALSGRTLRTTIDDLHGDGRLLVNRTRSGRLVRAVLYEISIGVDLTGMPERKYIERILRHQGVQVC